MIKSIFKIFIALLIIILIFTTSFYFYGSSGNLSKSKYLQINSNKSFSSNQDTISIITYNIGYLSGMSNNLPVETNKLFFQSNQNKLISLINRIDPDIVAFQEIDYESRRSFYANQIDSISMKTSLQNTASAINWDKKYVPFPYWPLSKHFGQVISGQSVASRFPIESNEAIVLDKRYDAPFYYKAFYLDRLIQINKINVSGTSVYILNVHLEAFDIETREKQSLKVRLKYNELARDNPVILLGDFNAMADDQMDKTIANILDGKNISKAITDSTYLSDKFSNYTYSSGEPSRKIDYIFFNDKINLVNASVLSEAGQISDHIPVMMSFSIRED